MNLEKIAGAGEIEGVVDVQPVSGDVVDPGRVPAFREARKQRCEVGRLQGAVRAHRFEFRADQFGTTRCQTGDADPFAGILVGIGNVGDDAFEQHWTRSRPDLSDRSVRSRHMESTARTISPSTSSSASRM